jgi:phage tail sheath gpL-like
MSITTSVPSSKRKPGSYQEFDVTSGARGLVPIAYNIVLVGNKLAAGTKANLTPTLVGSEKDGDLFWGAGSELAIMVRAALRAGRKYGAVPFIYGISIADVAGTAATRTFTVAGTATAAGDVVITFGGRTIRCTVNNGDVANTVAAAVKAAIDNYQNVEPLAFTASIAAPVVTMTARQTGVNGNDWRGSVLSAPAGITVTYAVAIAGVGAVVIQPALDILVDKYYHGCAIANHTATDVTSLASFAATNSLPQTKKWPISILCETGSLTTGNTTATTANNYQIVVVNAEFFPNHGSEIAAQMTSTLFAENDPSLSFDSVELDLFVPLAADVPTDTEIETALAAGSAILSVSPYTGNVQIVRFVTTKTTIGGAVFENLLDVTNVKTMFYTAIQVDVRWTIWQQNKDNRKNTTGASKRLRSITLDTLRAEEDLEYVQNVDAHMAELIVEKDAIVKTRLNVGIPVSVVPNLHQLVGVHTLFVE